MPPGLRMVQKVSSTRAFARIAPHVIPALDRAVHRLTRGKVLLSARMLPGVILTATGARSGQPRRTPLACMPEDGGSWLLIGSNFGRPGHPAWTGNLLKHPEAEVSWRGADIRGTGPAAHRGGAGAGLARGAGVLAAVCGLSGAGRAGDPAVPAGAALSLRGEGASPVP